MEPLNIAILFLSTQAVFVLGLRGVVKTVKEEADHQKRDGSQPQKLQRVFLQHFRNILDQRDIVFVALSVSTLAGIAWAVNVAVLFGQVVQVWAFSLALIEALVVFLAIEVVYLLSWKWLPTGWRENKLFRRAVDIATLSGALVFSISSATGCMYNVNLSCSAFGWLGDLVFATFFIAFFISGIGEMSIVDTISDTVSSHVPLRRKTHFLYIGLLLFSMAALAVFAGMGYIFGPGTGYVIVGADLATGFGIVYLSYLLIRGRESEHFSTLVYGVLMFGLSGIFFAYSFRNLLPPTINLTGVSLESPTDLVLPLTLFAIGYLSLSIQIPKSAERKLGIRHERLVASLTFLMVFAVVANYQRALLSGLGSAVFFFEQGVPISLGLWAGAIVFGFRKVKSAGERGRVMSGPLVHACLSCGQRLEPTSKYCWSCGSSKLKTERILFAGDARQVFDAPRHHSRKRKLASFLAGGPFGFFAFGMDIPRKSGPESQIVVTNNATYFAGKTYPLNRISDVKRGHYSNSIVLNIRDPVVPTVQKPGIGNETRPSLSLELKTSNPVALTRAIERATPRYFHPV